MGFLKKLFRHTEPTKPASMPWEEADKIIQTYVAVMQTQAPTPGCAADVSKLPYPKDQIKTALITGLLTVGDPSTKEMLKVAYVQLADWQEGVGDIDQGLDMTKLDLDGDITKLAEQVLAQGPGRYKWIPMINAEKEKLQQDLVRMGLW